MSRTWDYIVVVTEPAITDTPCELYLTESEYEQFMLARKQGATGAKEWVDAFKNVSPDSVVDIMDSDSMFYGTERDYAIENGLLTFSTSETEDTVPITEQDVAPVEVKDETQIGGLLIGLLLGIIGFCAISVHLLKMLEHSTKESVDILMKNGVISDEQSEKKVEVETTSTSTPFEQFQIDLKKNIEKLRNIRKAIFDEEIKTVINKDIDLLEEIYKNVDETEFNKGNVAKLNDGATNGYITIVLNLVHEYIKFSKYTETEVTKTVTKQTLDDLKSTLLRTPEAFSKILVESLEKELMNASVESNLFVNLAVRNGVLTDKNTLVLQKN